MTKKNIVLYERYDGVRFVLERSLFRYHQDIEISSSRWKNEIMQLIKNKHIDLLITELSNDSNAGLEISRCAKRINPDTKILCITMVGDNKAIEFKKEFGNIYWLEKPLEINDFRRLVAKALELGDNHKK